MKLLITEDRIKELMVTYIKSRYPQIYDIKFTTNTVHLGSGPKEEGGPTEIKQTIVNVLINNLETNYTEYYLRRELCPKILDELETFPNVGFYAYGSEWGIRFYQAKKELIWSI